jgi:mono/diheme cytochrome c family protein
MNSINNNNSMETGGQKFEPFSRTRDKRIRRSLDGLMALVCVVILVKGCRQSEIDYSAPPPAKAENQEVQPVAQDPPPRPQTPATARPAAPAPRQTSGISKAMLDQGKKVYTQSCLVCHQPNGQGLPGVFPPLAKSDFLMADKERSIRIVLQGQTGEIVVNGVKYNGVMPPVPLKDEQTAQVLTYVRNSWGNSGEPVTVEEVKSIRAEIDGTLADAR